jgi:hypothetical protein
LGVGYACIEVGTPSDSGPSTPPQAFFGDGRDNP